MINSLLTRVFGSRNERQLRQLNRIVAKINELMALCDRLEASLSTGDEIRRSLLDALLHEALTPAEGVVLEQPERVVAHG